MTDIEELPSQRRAEIGHVFSVYKDPDPTRRSEVKGWDDRDAATATINEARERFGAPGGRARSVS